jgi:molybdopterin-synthase adenylyltransferase
MKKTEIAEIRVPLHLIGRLRAGLAFRGTHESAVFCLASHARLQNRTLLLVKKVIPLPEDAYVPSSANGAKWAGRAMLPILNEALKEELGVILVHAHPHAGPVSLSRDDSQSAHRLLPLFQTVVSARPHVSVVLGKTHADGIALLPGQTDFIGVSSVRLLGKTITDLGSREDGPAAREEGDTYHRQALLTGSTGERNIRRARIAVVGLSGGGSHVVQQLARMGVGEIAGIDGDRVDESNRSRLIGMIKLDVLLRRRKTDVMARLVRGINRRVKFVGISQPIPLQQAIDVLKESDIVIGCVDSYHARADLQELTWRYMIPYVDIGLLIRPLGDDSGVTIGGHVMTLIPGGFCQWCIDALSDEKLSSETGGRSWSYFQGTDKQAQVVSMNGVLASQAVSEVLQLLTAFAPIDEGLDFKKFDGLEGTLQKWNVKQRINCPKCNAALGAGDVVWH